MSGSTIERADVEAAAERIAGHVRRTPALDTQHAIGAVPRCWLKLEFLQHSGTFKARGAFNRLLAAKEAGELDPKLGVAIASGGNAGLASAWAARELGVPAHVFVPTLAPARKVEQLQSLGARVVQVGAFYSDALDACRTFTDESGALFVHAYDMPEVAAGAGTLALELLEDAELDTIVVAVGGGGLLAGIAAAAEGRAKVVAVEQVGAPTLHEALKAGRPVDVAVSGNAVDSLGAKRIGDIAFSVATRTGVRSVLVTDEATLDARTALWRHFRIATEHGAAVAWAALTSGAYVPAPGERIGVVVCGSNTDPTTL